MEHNFNGSEGDLIAIAFIYLPILTQQIEHFVHLWNIHKIRNQAKRPYLVPGKPVLNFYHPHLKNPDARFCGRQCREESLATLQAAVKGYGMYQAKTKS